MQYYIVYMYDIVGVVLVLVKDMYIEYMLIDELPNVSLDRYCLS